MEIQWQWVTCMHHHFCSDGMASYADEVLMQLAAEAKDTGLECHPFKIGWYNTRVQPPFHLPYSNDTFAVIIISTPSMFEQLFLPYLATRYQQGQLDPLDQCLAKWFEHCKKAFSRWDVKTIQDFELHPTRRPKVLVQTAGHVAGATYYYQRSDVSPPDPWPETKTIFGVSVHPKYGGWFALRGVLIFKDLLTPELQQKDPVDCVPTQKQRIELLEKFNLNWQDWSYRDVTGIEVTEKYSETQQQYFATEPSKRFELIKTLQGRTDVVP